MDWSTYPYTGVEGRCQYDASKGYANTNGYYYGIPYDSGASLANGINSGPVSVALDGENNIFWFYTSGIITDTSCPQILNHGVAAIGYNDYDFIIRNSWGTDWGEGGYARLGYVAGDNQKGICGVQSLAVWPWIN